MKYIIMCGGVYNNWSTPRQLMMVDGERVVSRTIRLLRKYGVRDIAISSNYKAYEFLGVPVLSHNNDFITDTKTAEGLWIHAFYPTEEPVCYLFGDVVFSDKAIQTIVNTPTDDIQFFASSPPFSKHYTKPWAEPFALKVVNTKHLKNAIKKTEEYHREGLFRRHPIMWELWQVIKGTPLNEIDYKNYIAINDFTCDIDKPEDIAKIEKAMKEAR